MRDVVRVVIHRPLSQEVFPFAQRVLHGPVHSKAQFSLSTTEMKSLVVALNPIKNRELLRVDDERLAPLLEKAGELGVPVMFHTADTDAFFLPIDRFNERYEELAAHPDWGFSGAHFSKAELLAQRDRVFSRHPRTTFVAAHVAERSEDLAYVGRLLDAHPNLMVDMSARTAELGRQPYTAREF